MSGRTVLLVDDEPHVTRVLRLNLERAGYRVFTANNGEAGLKQFLECQPDALLTDVRMPRMTGKEMVLTLVKQYPERRFPVLVMTSSVEREHRDWVEEVPDLTLIEKPVSPRRIVEFLDHWFRDTAAAGEVG